MKDDFLERITRDSKRFAIRRKKNLQKQKRLQKMTCDTPLDEAPHFMNSEAGTADDGQVVLGVYGTEDWIASTIARRRFVAGKKTVQSYGTWLVEASFDLIDFAKKYFEYQFMFFGATTVVGYTEKDAIIKIDFSRGKIQCEIAGDVEEHDQWMDFFNEKFKKAEALIEWIYNSRGDDISVPLNFRAGIRAAYPWIDHNEFATLNDYIDSYIDSTASVLILIGPPGTGKTTFIKNLIHRSKSNAKVTYDPKIMMDDGFFAGFINDDTTFLVLEDADEFLRSRADGNNMMHKFLNLSDGLISAADKKLVFSTNLPDVSDVDEALMRPGRCYDVLKFRTLTRDEAQAVVDEIGTGQKLPDGKEITLAELFSSQPSNTKLKKRSIGFVS